MPYAKIVDLDAVKRLMELWLKAVLSPDPAPAAQVPIYFEWQSGTKANSKPFATYKIFGPEKPTVTDDVLIEGGLPFLEGNHVFHVEVQTYSDGEEAAMMAHALIESLEQPQFYNIIELGSGSLNPVPSPAFQCSVAQVREPIDLTEYLETKYERRTMLEFDLIVSATAALIDGTLAGDGIKHVHTNGEALDGTGNNIEMDVTADHP